jgi:hypothetical protein
LWALPADAGGGYAEHAVTQRLDWAAATSRWS